MFQYLYGHNRLARQAISCQLPANHVLYLLPYRLQTECTAQAPTTAYTDDHVSTCCVPQRLLCCFLPSTVAANLVSGVRDHLVQVRFGP